VNQMNALMRAGNFFCAASHGLNERNLRLMQAVLRDVPAVIAHLRQRAGEGGEGPGEKKPRVEPAARSLATTTTTAAAAAAAAASPAATAVSATAVSAATTATTSTTSTPATTTASAPASDAIPSLSQSEWAAVDKKFVSGVSAMAKVTAKVGSAACVLMSCVSYLLCMCV
jgi:hypothetical protein